MSSFEVIAPALAELGSFPHAWFVCGGWAIDLFVGEVTRDHEDLEVGVFRHHQAALRAHYRGWSAYKSVGGWALWDEEEHLELPIHQLLFRTPESGPPEPWEPNYEERQFFLNEVEGGMWICRRDPRITLHVRQVAQRSEEGVPIVIPEVQLLYKAKRAEEKDEHDFQLVVARLPEGRRRWLRDALQLAHPGHRWIQALP